MFIPLRKVLFGEGRERGFTLIELLIVVLIVGILAAVAIPLYVGYVKDAKTAEAKSVAGALWTGFQANGLQRCGTAVSTSEAYTRAGLTAAGATVPARWSVTAGGTNTLTVTCATGAYVPSAANLFTISGVGADVTAIQVRLNYVATNNPPSRMQCSVDTGGTFNDC